MIMLFFLKFSQVINLQFWCNSYLVYSGVGVSCRILYSKVIYMQAVTDQLPRFGERELVCLLSFTCGYVVSVRRGFLFL